MTPMLMYGLPVVAAFNGATVPAAMRHRPIVMSTESNIAAMAKQLELLQLQDALATQKATLAKLEAAAPVAPVPAPAPLSALEELQMQLKQLEAAAQAPVPVPAPAPLSALEELQMQLKQLEAAAQAPAPVAPVPVLEDLVQIPAPMAAEEPVGATVQAIMDGVGAATGAVQQMMGGSVPTLDGASLPLPTMPSLPTVPEELAWQIEQAGTLITSLVPTLPPLPPLPDLAAVSPELDATAQQLVGAVQQADALIHNPIFGELTPAGAALQMGAIAAFAVGGAIASADTNNEAPYDPGSNSYDPKVADAYYAARPLLVARRLCSLAYLTSSFSTGLLFDWLVLGKLLKDEEYKALKQAEPRRAKQALLLCEQLGPTFIKLGQALSIRTDLIPEAYALELRQLQDAVPPFPTDEAYEVLCKQLGVRSVDEVFDTLSARPVASASIGQVYRGTLKDENRTSVAVKVQRPGILAEIALDLYVLRLITPIQTILQNTINGVKTAPEDIDVAIQLVDEWGRGFVAETDYKLEAKNTIEFEASMRARGLDAVCAPTVVPELVRDTVLVTEWVEGTRLDRDASPDVPRLCGVAINAYLTMLLDTGVLHCDPHPGNLLRTTDGRLCILDWGMTLEVPSNLQYALLEFIAHLNTEDYEAVPQDFVNLGFSPEGVSADRLKASGITDGLSFAFRQLSAGGGPKKIAERVEVELKERYGAELTGPELEKKAQEEMMQAMEAQLAAEGVDVKGVTNIMEEMSKRNRELFALPPYILYVARAFSTLEGIGLSINEDYAIVQECYPYLARRLFTDRSPRAKAALRAMLGLDGPSAPASALLPPGSGEVRGMVVPTAAPALRTGVSGLSPAKLVEMSDNFVEGTSAIADVDRDGAGINEAARELADLLIAPEGSTLQDILIDESAKLGDAALRRAIRQALIDGPSSVFAPLGLKPPAALDALLAVTPDDEAVLGTAQELSDLLAPRVREQLDGLVTPTTASITDTVGSLVNPLISDATARDDAARTVEGVSTLSRRIGALVLRRAASRATDTPSLPDAARDALVNTNTALADALDVEMAAAE